MVENDLDRFGRPWIIASLFKIRPRSAVHGSLHFLFKNRTDSTVRGSLRPLLKIRTKSALQGSPHYPLKKLNRLGRPWILASLFLNSGQIGGSRIPALPFKNWTDSAVHESLHPFFNFGSPHCIRPSVNPCISFLKFGPNR